MSGESVVTSYRRRSGVKPRPQLEKPTSKTLLRRCRTAYFFSLRPVCGAGNTLGQDLNLNMERLLSSRNFTNKLWNAGKFIDFNLADVRTTCLGALNTEP